MNERSIFDAALEITDPAERAAYLDKACGDQPGLRKQLDELLAAKEKLGSFLARPAALEDKTGAYEPVRECPGTTVGPYKLMEQIGEGGFGLVFVAEQQQPVRRKVALKIIKPGMDTREVIARFEAERQALALMDHPNIARVFDAGATETGRPYFVMELVKGIPITEYCDQQQLTATRAAGTVSLRLPGRAARPHQRHHPPRSEALEHSRSPSRRGSRGQGHRLRHREGHRAAVDGENDLHAIHADDRHAALHEPRAGRGQRARRGHPQRRLQPRRAALRTADRHDAVRPRALREGGLRRNSPHHQGGGAAQAEHAAEHDGRDIDRRSPRSARRSQRSCPRW